MPVIRRSTPLRAAAQPRPLFPPILDNELLRRPAASRPYDPYLPYRRRIARTKNVVLSFEGGELQAWYWPVNSRYERVTPDELVTHRLTHKFLGPGCMCALRNPTADAFVEASIFCVERGAHTGEWVAACASSACKYFVLLEKFYAKNGVPCKMYPRRNADEAPAPDPVVLERPFEIPSPVASPERRVERPQAPPAARPYGPNLPPLLEARRRRTIAASQARVRTDDDPFVLPVGTVEEPNPPEDAFARLLRLDSYRNPGLSVRRFQALFTKCQCGTVMTRRAYAWHDCPFKGLVIDLTGEE
ncbi:hypothetical protein BV20DRAFT_1048641 [Pilatotrama ljubarskyi]|nr:hypothetical protein BV20DRAFT_1048641 [Pilatotrama ljubarskyi]